MLNYTWHFMQLERYTTKSKVVGSIPDFDQRVFLMNKGDNHKELSSLLLLMPIVCKDRNLTFLLLLGPPWLTIEIIQLNYENAKLSSNNKMCIAYYNNETQHNIPCSFIIQQCWLTNIKFTFYKRLLHIYTVDTYERMWIMIIQKWHRHTSVTATDEMFMLRQNKVNKSYAIMQVRA